ncbi:hypothetical protein [Halococcus thailandensis]|uniref:Uncharacterized protein n=1 Tax=Halococcus thailandensis JCM 13552 TaxID=1227457 RepID=M0NI08_9EURY|nr:hypothetical protein [Halococcus thailandensis]EMA56300.1 hypothetical protein C451_03129 [Halococcus thailandensis JCM 13552]
MSEAGDSRHSRLCPDHRRDHVSSGACVACAQARRIAELEQTVEKLAVCIEELKGNNETETAAQETRSDQPEHRSTETII